MWVLVEIPHYVLNEDDEREEVPMTEEFKEELKGDIKRGLDKQGWAVGDVVVVEDSDAELLR